MKWWVWLIFRDWLRIKSRVLTINAVIARQREWQGEASGECWITDVRKKSENQDTDTAGFMKELWN